MPTTPINALRTPALDDAANVPMRISNLADDVDTRLVARFASTTARDAAIPAPIAGMTCYLTNTRAYSVYDGTLARWIYWDTAVQTYTPTLGAGVSVGSGGSATNKGEYTRQGRRVFLRITTVFGTTGTNFGAASTPWTWTLPPGMSINTGLGFEQTMAVRISAPGLYVTAAAWAGGASSTTLSVQVPTSFSASTNLQLGSPTNAAGQSVVIHGFFDNVSATT